MEEGTGSGSGPSAGTDLGQKVVGVVVGDRRTENELLDCSMESTGEDLTRSPGGTGESILDESGDDSEGSMDTGEKAAMDTVQEDGGVYFRVPAGVDNREEDVFMTPAVAKEADERKRQERRRQAQLKRDKAWAEKMGLQVEKEKEKEELEKKILEEENELEARALQEKRRLEKEKRMEAREERIRMEEEEAKEAMRIRKEEGRSKGAAKVKVDHRYYAVRSMREHKVVGRELNKKNDGSVFVETNSSFQGEDERWLRNYNIHNMEKQVNISCSYNPRNGLCYTCFGEPHSAREGREGQPVTYVLTDQSFPANVPATDGGEFFRVLRVEDGTVQEITNAFLELNGGRKMEPGTIIMLGSLTKLGTVGTPFYALEWSRCRCRLI